MVSARARRPSHRRAGDHALQAGPGADADARREHRRGAQRSTGETWANSGDPFALIYEEASIYAQGQFDYQAAAGYAYDVWALPTVTVAAGNRIVIAADSVTLKVVEAAAVAGPGPLRRIRCNLVTS
jgi:uncharacterized protein (DUF2345 family)